MENKYLLMKNIYTQQEHYTFVKLQRFCMPILYIFKRIQSLSLLGYISVYQDNVLFNKKHHSVTLHLHDCIYVLSEKETLLTLV